MVEIRLVQGDITTIEADAIVNAANEHLVLGSGVAGAIRRKGGAAIQEECHALAPIGTGEAVATGAGMLPHRWVIHAVAPRVSMSAWRERLAAAMTSVLDVAEDVGASSVVVPALGTGVFGLPVAAAADIMLATVRDRGADCRVLKRVTFCLYTAAGFQAFKEARTRLDV